MAPTDFIYQISDEEKRSKYLQTLVRILIVEGRDEPWRFSQTFETKGNEPCIPAMAGHMQKMENEGVVKRVYDSNSRVEYRLAADRNEVIKVIEHFNDHLDENHRKLFEVF